MHNNSSRTTATDEDELDKLLQGLDQLTETLPDLNKASQHQQQPTLLSPPQRPTQQSQALISPQKILSPTQLQQQLSKQVPRKILPDFHQPSQQIQRGSTDFYQAAAQHSQNNNHLSKDMELVQPYHTRSDSKPFSYFRTNTNGSRTASRASSRETNGLGGCQPSGLESPNILRKIMGNGDSLNSDSRPISPSGKNHFMIFFKLLIAILIFLVCYNTFPNVLDHHSRYFMLNTGISVGFCAIYWLHK